MLWSRITAFAAFLIVFVSPLYYVQAASHDVPQVLIISQVRGEECCGTGTMTALSNQIKTLEQNNVSGYFALRYDVLQNKKYIDILRKATDDNPKIIRLGLLLEVTPGLAKDAGIDYSAPEDNWYEAPFVYSIGYTDEENKKMMDLLFQKFHQSFGYYPTVTSSWMIKTETLNYVYDTYGVEIHQITKEQFGTDSYTLYGGPAHYPYTSSRNWSFIPDFTEQNAPVIVRQTVTDPLFNYGNLSAYTSQPNDYAADGKSFQYFKMLINQALFEQSQPGFALLGLETSMDERYQKEFMNQIKYVGELRKNKQIILPDAEELSSYWKNQNYSVYQGKNLIESNSVSAYWITAPTYRVRILRSENDLFITDIRYYDPAYTDPYASTAAKKDGFWVVPYLVDGSETETKGTKIAYSRQNDTKEPLSYIRLPPITEKIEPTVSRDTKGISFMYTDNADRQRTIVFLENTIQLPSFSSDEITAVNTHSSDYPIQVLTEENGFTFSWKSKDKVFLALSNQCSEQGCTISFSSDASLLDIAREDNSINLFPEPDYRSLSTAKTDIYFNNQFAVAQRNPIRLVIDPRDETGSPTQLPIKQIHIKHEKDISYSLLSHNNLYFIDFISNVPQQDTISITISDKITFENAVYFAPNCKDTPLACIRNPVHGMWYLRSYLGDKMRIMNDKIQEVLKPN